MGIEVKYAETLTGTVARHRARYDEAAQGMGCFAAERLPELRRQPLEQLWRNHLLAGSLLLDRASAYHQGASVVLYPTGNAVVRDAVNAYRACLTSETTATSWTLEAVMDALADQGAGPWSAAIRQRYLG